MLTFLWHVFRKMSKTSEDAAEQQRDQCVFETPKVVHVVPSIATCKIKTSRFDNIPLWILTVATSQEFAKVLRPHALSSAALKGYCFNCSKAKIQ